MGGGVEEGTVCVYVYVLDIRIVRECRKTGPVSEGGKSEGEPGKWGDGRRPVKK